MLGKKILDPKGVESPLREVDGIGLLDIETHFGTEKITRRVEAEIKDADFAAGDPRGGLPHFPASVQRLRGYEIHMGESFGEIGLFALSTVSGPSGLRQMLVLDGSRKGNCWGTYLHGIFDNDEFRRGIINRLRLKKGLGPREPACSYSAIKENEISRLADVVRSNIDMEFIRETVGL